MTQEHVTFSFGENWLDYLDTIGEEQFQAAHEALERLLQTDDLAGQSFLDIGCGSGIHSLAAIKMGAGQVIGVDVDPFSVQASRQTQEKFGVPNWEIKKGSILEADFWAKLDPADIVYSWGVLHHTGRMWPAIENASQLVKPNGKFVIAIYNKRPTSEFWLKFKRFYNRTNPVFKTMMVWSLVLPRIPVRLVKGKHPIKDRRGMNIYHDAIDWAGGLPYEYASVAEIVEFCEQRGFKLIYFTETQSYGCNEFVFEKVS
ncbi:MAG: class I SAM-dependent methyltransferase [Anaerolineae bacterium]